jgi:hypothetical protein
MGAEHQAFVDLSFQGRLTEPSLFRADIFYFRELLENYGWDALSVPTYARLTGNVTRSGRKEMLLKTTGVWTHLWLEERKPGVFVLYDQSG